MNFLLPHLVHKPPCRRAFVVVADGDLPHFAQVWGLDGELVLAALFKVVVVIIEEPFTLNHETMCEF